MQYKVIERNKKFFLLAGDNEVIDQYGDPVCFIRKTAYERKEQAHDKMIELFLAKPTPELLSKSERWARYKVAPNHPSKTVHVNEHWRRPPTRKPNWLKMVG